MKAMNTASLCLLFILSTVHAGFAESPQTIKIVAVLEEGEQLGSWLVAKWWAVPPGMDCCPRGAGKHFGIREDRSRCVLCKCQQRTFFVLLRLEVYARRRVTGWADSMSALAPQSAFKRKTR